MSPYIRANCGNLTSSRYAQTAIQQLVRLSSQILISVHIVFIVRCETVWFDFHALILLPLYTCDTPPCSCSDSHAPFTACLVLLPFAAFCDLRRCEIGASIEKSNARESLEPFAFVFHLLKLHLLAPYWFLPQPSSFPLWDFTLLRPSRPLLCPILASNSQPHSCPSSGQIHQHGGFVSLFSKWWCWFPEAS